MSAEQGFNAPRHWRLKDQRYRLVGEECPDCDTKIFPPRDICPNCHTEAKIPLQFSGKGTIYSYAKVNEAPSEFEGIAPYTIAIIRLEEGPLVTAQLTDLGEERVKIGTPVEMVTRKLSSAGDRDLILYGYKFRPILTISSNIPHQL